MRISTRADYAVRAAVHLATATDGRPIKGDAIATAQAIPLKFLERSRSRSTSDDEADGCASNDPLEASVGLPRASRHSCV